MTSSTVGSRWNKAVRHIARTTQSDARLVFSAMMHYFSFSRGREQKNEGSSSLLSDARESGL
jgi:hypothetical protein